MSHRKLTFTVELNIPPEAAFSLLHTPSSIRQWWGAMRAVVWPEPGGIWVTTWGDDENSPNFISTARILVFEPPRILTLGDFRYHSKVTPMNFSMSDFKTHFEVKPTTNGAELKIEQTGFPRDPEADEFYHRCDIGWKNTLTSIKIHAEKHAATVNASAAP